jgi:membrane protease YdiL (CAAX protease family)
MKHLTNSFTGLNHWWRYLLLFIISLLIGSFIGGIPLGVVIVASSIQSGGELVTSPDVTNLAAFGIDLNLGLALMMLPFIVCLLLLLLLFKPFHQRNYKTLFSGESKIRWKRFFTAALVWTVLLAIYLIVDYSLAPENFTLNFEPSSFAILVVISLIFIPIQASYEEIMFRGYLAQGVAKLTKNRILVILIPAIIFGLIHSFNPEIEEYGFLLAMPQYILFGLIFGLITVFDDGIELAMGAHTANNIFLSLFVTNKASALQTPAYFVQENVDAAKDLLVMSAIGILFVIIIARMYRFKFGILTKKLVAETIE